MQNNNQNQQLALQTLIKSILETNSNTTSKNQKKNIFNFFKSNSEKKQNSQSAQQIQVLQMHEYLKLFCSQKKPLNQKRWEKIMDMNQSLQIQQESFRSLFMVSSQANYRRLQHPGYYYKLVESFKDYPKQMFLPIQKDVPRTLADNHPFQQPLKNILQVYSIRNSSLLYCQGMNYLVSYFLINSVSEEESFWLLTSLIENILPDDYFRDLSTISITSQIFNDLLQHIFPELTQQMKEIGMDCSLFLVTWYVCLFTKGFINSVSAYLLSKLILQSRRYQIGFVILKLSLGVIAAVLGSDQPFTFKKQFKHFREKLQVSVYEISLLEMKFGVEFIQLNYENYMKLQRQYRTKRDQRHIKLIERELNEQKLTLPVCNKQFPICLQRIQIQKKIGIIEEVRIYKNGYPIISQYIQDYFVSQKNLKQSQSSSTICSAYSSIQDCNLSRYNHVCLQHQQPSLRKKLDTKIIFKHEQFDNDKYIVLQQEGSCSFQIKSKFSKMDEKLAQLSGYFVVDQNYNIDEDLDGSDNQQKDQQQSEVQVFNLQKELRLSEINDKQKQQQQSQNRPKQQVKSPQIAQNYNQIQIKKQQIVPQNYQKNAAYHQRLMANLGKTLKRVLRIKQDQLN